MARRSYDKQFKIAAVKLVLEDDIKKLKQENLELRRELDLLKKFQAFLKKKSM